MKPGILARAGNFVRRVRGGLSGGQINRRMEDQRQWQISAADERKFRGRRQGAINTMLEEQFNLEKRQLLNLFAKDGILNFNRVQLGRDAEKLKKFEAKLLFMFALNEGFITDGHRAREQFSRWLKQVDAEGYCRLMQERFPDRQPPSPEIIKALQKDIAGTYRNLRLNAGDEHEANLLIRSIVRIQQGQEE